MADTGSSLHPMARPRPAVMVGLLGISLCGVGVMLWGLDHDQWGVLIVGWALSVAGGALTTWVYWTEISKLRHPRQIERGTRAETVVACAVIAVAFLLPPYLASLRDKESFLVVEHSNIVITPDYMIVENIDFRNKGELAAISFNKGCYRQTSQTLLTDAEEREGMKRASREMDQVDVSGFPPHIEPGSPFRESCFFPSNQTEYERIKNGLYFYSFLYSEYLDEKLQYGTKHVFLECHFYKGRFTIADNCRNYRGTYLVSKDNQF
jgi:hypothetical protein